jgi:mannosyl-oligosaccharide alpha-1,2-mannosidase
MGLHDEFNRGVSFIKRSDFSQPAVRAFNLHVHITSFTFIKIQGVFVPFFETVIRYLGGLLSAYALSREPILLTRADDLGRLLAPAFGTESGFPSFGVSTST